MTIITPEPLDNEGVSETSELVESVVSVADVAVQSADDRARAAEQRAVEAERRCGELEAQLREATAEPPEVHINVTEEVHEEPAPEVVPVVEEPEVIKDTTPVVKQETESDHKAKVNKRRKGMRLYGKARK